MINGLYYSSRKIPESCENSFMDYQEFQNKLRKGLFFNPCSPEGFFQTYFPKGGGGCCNPLWIINTEGHITLNLLPVYRYGHPLSIDTKISTNH